MGIQSPIAIDRISMALLLRSSNPPRYFTELTELLKDPDPVVRRVAAETLMGPQECLKKRHARDYGYEKVLEAEGHARVLFKQLEKAEVREAFFLTRKIIDLGSPALMEVVRHFDRSKSFEGVQAAYIAQEIIASSENALPPWAEEIRRKMERTISFDFKEMVSSEALLKLGSLTGIPVRLDPRFSSTDLLNEKISLSVKDMEVRLAFAWLSKITDTIYRAENEALFFTARYHACGIDRVLFDVRDLDPDGRVNWVEILQAELPEIGEYITRNAGTDVSYRRGFLVVWYFWSNERWYTRRELTPLAHWLNEKRRMLDLEPIPYKIPDYPINLE